ncbi:MULTISPECIES: helix-turn-helix domain-containing protein [unclassified Sporolactobacillus]|uniref:helix-turn-helix domain-containing protein n=1 Tax=unclassified Sporolactobacillus TaxID=2628533 RepID=UPI00236841CD|nr:helix-turn-helix transcriptional regulator [Sporolactobacillus sp. CQH2019]MDD9147341.1 helix-turn-helix transcriptional regulator [Sporolactobacillus sp. CQH2019]
MRNTLGSRIRFLRDEKNLSQVEMADQLKISNVQLSRYESGARKPDPEMLVQIADYLNVSTDFLLGRTPLVHEPQSVYVSREDVRLLERIKQMPGLFSFIEELPDHPDETIQLMKIWEILRER